MARIAVLSIVLLCLHVVYAHDFSDNPLAPRNESIRHKGCIVHGDNPEPAHEHILAATKKVSMMMEAAASNATTEVMAKLSSTIDVIYHVLYSLDQFPQGKDTELRYAGGRTLESFMQISTRKQNEALNAGYMGSGFQFESTYEINWIEDAQDLEALTGGEEWNDEYFRDHVTPKHNVDTARHVNVYLMDMGRTGLLGISSFPNSDEENPTHAIANSMFSLPGGQSPNDLGITLVHEMGHYLGLYHTFQGGCEGGDEIADTPAEAEPNFGSFCKRDGNDRDTCPGGGEDPINNYMDYSDDKCLVEFSKDQWIRMNAQVSQFRPSLIGL